MWEVSSFPVPQFSLLSGSVCYVIWKSVNPLPGRSMVIRRSMVFHCPLYYPPEALSYLLCTPNSFPASESRKPYSIFILIITSWHILSIYKPMILLWFILVCQSSGASFLACTTSQLVLLFLAYALCSTAYCFVFEFDLTSLLSPWYSITVYIPNIKQNT